uniref:Si:dkey-83h2.3 n=1 Tax=Paramormyrops kingsleyae TaxID=1676925 RepID=A0A3B3T342_9TELE
MCVGRCSRFVGWSLVPMSVLSMLSNTLLLFPDLKARYLLEGHVTPEATWSTGLWASGLLVLVAARSFISNNLQRSCCGFRIEMMWQIGTSSVAVAAAGICFLISSAGLACGPLCLHNSTEGLIWDQPLKKLIRRGSPYFPIQAWQTLTCEEPSGVVPWNAVLFSVLLATSGIQVLLCAAQTLNALLGMLCGQGFGRNKVRWETVRPCVSAGG